MQPNNEEIISVLSETQAFLRKKLIELSERGATSYTLSNFTSAMSNIDYALEEPPPGVGMARVVARSLIAPET